MQEVAPVQPKEVWVY